MDAVNCFVKVNAQLSFPVCALPDDILIVKICSLHSFPSLNLTCSFPSSWSTVFNIHLMMILAKIFLGTEKGVIPRQMLHSLRVPVLGILLMTSRFVQSIYFVTLFGNTSQSTNKHGSCEDLQMFPILPITTALKMSEKNYHYTRFCAISVMGRCFRCWLGI